MRLGGARVGGEHVIFIKGGRRLNAGVCCKIAEQALEALHRQSSRQAPKIAPVLRVELRRKVRRPHDGAVWVNGPVRHALKERPLVARNRRPESTYCGPTRPGSWTPQLGGERAFGGRFRKDRSPGESRRSHCERETAPEAGVRRRYRSANAGKPHSSASPALRTPSNRGGRCGAWSVSHLTVRLGFRRRASASADFASSVLPARA